MTARLVAFLIGGALCVPSQGSQQRFDYVQVHMGTSFRIALYAEDSLSASEAARDAFVRIEELDSLLSDYRVDSELSKVSNSAESGRAVLVGKDLRAVLEFSQRTASRTNGAFDVTVGALTRIWRRSARRDKPPEASDVHEARRSVGFQHLSLKGDSVRLLLPGMRLDLGGIAKGYAADEALRTIRSHSIDQALVDAGGDIAVGAPPPDSCGWRIMSPFGEALLLRNQAVAVSGPAYRAIAAGGVQYSHILDPRTGRSMTDKRIVQVVTSRAVLADAYASAFSVMKPEDAFRVARYQDDMAVKIKRTVSGVRQLHALRGIARTETSQSNILECSTPPLVP